MLEFECWWNEYDHGSSKSNYWTWLEIREIKKAPAEIIMYEKTMYLFWSNYVNIRREHILSCLSGCSIVILSREFKIRKGVIFSAWRKSRLIEDMLKSRLLVLNWLLNFVLNWLRYLLCCKIWNWSLKFKLITQTYSVNFFVDIRKKWTRKRGW